MGEGRLSISRSRERDETPAPDPVRRLSIVARGDPASRLGRVRVSPLYRPVNDRLAALERLACLHRQGALSDEEFVAEKVALLRRDPEGLVLNEPLLDHEPPEGTSLLEGLFGWRLIPIGVFAGLVLSYLSQPRETVHFFGDVLSLFGG